MLEFLEKLNKSSIPYVSWKNNHEIGLALKGTSDLDLFVPLEFRNRFYQLCSQEEWLVAKNPIAHYPWITHFYKVGKELRVNHLHVYFKIVTGESWLKEYILPLDKWLIDNRERHPGSGTWVLNNQAQAYLFTLRHLLKCGSLLSRLLYFKEMAGYRKEWLKCARDLNSISCEAPLDIRPFLSGARLTADDFSLPTVRQSISFRTSVFPFLRLSLWSLPIRRLIAFFRRALNKIIFKRKKILPNGGLVIAISGVDGAGKSTMVREAVEFFCGFLTVEQYHIGRPQGSLLELVRRLSISSAMRKNESKSIHSSSNISARKAVSATVLALLRLRLARKIRDRAQKGYLTIVDRWPTRTVGKMDGPKINLDNEKSILLKICGNLENWAYARMPSADVCYYFELPLSVAVERNRNRIKNGKELDEDIVLRYKDNHEFQPLARKTVLFDNAGPFAEKRIDFLLTLWSDITKH